ncbi:MAG: PGPGW domain-containing protein [Pirellulaceae bacterium]|nr:PGPGW domain-containing protein [Pirellulaceae bacterium]
MELWTSAKQNMQQLRDGQPGHRFRDYVKHRIEGRDKVTRLWNYIAGVALIAIGLAVGWLPGPGGFLALIGLAILAKEFPFIASWLDKAEVFLRRFVALVARPYRSFRRKRRTAAQSNK